MASRGKLLASLSRSLANSNQQKENYISKCKRYLATLPSSNKNAKKKLSFGVDAPGKPDAGDTVDNEHQNERVAPEVVCPAPAIVNASPSPGMFLLWKTGLVESPSKKSTENESIDKNSEQRSEDEPLDNVIDDNVEPTFPQNDIVDMNMNIQNNDYDNNEDGLLRDYGQEESEQSLEKENRIVVENVRKKKKDVIKKTIGKKSTRAIQRSFKSGFLTIKMNISQLQKKNDLESDFLLVVKNNASKKNKTNSSLLAEKYLTVGAGNLMEQFCSSSGLQYNPEEFAMLKSGDKSMDLDIRGTAKAIENINKRRGKKVVEEESSIKESEHEVEEDESPEVVSSDDSVSDVDIFNMRKTAINVATPGSSRIKDDGCLVFGNGSKQTSPELYKQRQSDLKNRKEASKKVEVDILGAKKKVMMKKKTKTQKKGVIRNKACVRF